MELFSMCFPFSWDVGVCGVFWWCWLAPKKREGAFPSCTHTTFTSVYSQIVFKHALRSDKNEAKPESAAAVLLHLHFLLLIWFWGPGKIHGETPACSCRCPAVLPWQHCLVPVISMFLSEEHTGYKGLQRNWELHRCLQVAFCCFTNLSCKLSASG